jgi:hypothetical protein
MRTWIAGAALAVLALAGCGGASAAPQVQAPAPSVSAVAASLHLTITDKISPPTMFASYEAHATTPSGQSVDLATFASDQLRDSWLRIASVFGPVLFKGPGYAGVGG